MSKQVENSFINSNVWQTNKEQINLDSIFKEGTQSKFCFVALNNLYQVVTQLINDVCNEASAESVLWKFDMFNDTLSSIKERIHSAIL